jgi:hypothetical protein
MKKHPEHIRKILKSFNIPDKAVIEVKVPEGMPRVCDYCNAVLIDEKGIALQKAHLTDYGLMCQKCIGDIKPITTYLEGQSVYYERWYQEGKER